MTEFEKMVEGQWYDPNASELCAMRQHAKQVCHRYNAIAPQNSEEKNQLLSELLNTPKTFEVLASFWCDYGVNITLGENFFANHNLVILDCAPVIFGDNVFIAPNCGFYTAEHPLDAPTRNRGIERAKPIRVGNNVWIGGGVQVLGGVTIGDNSVIGAGSVVTKDIPANVVAVGNPCRVLRPITEADSARL